MRALKLEQAAGAAGRPTASSVVQSGLGKLPSGAHAAEGSGGLEPAAAAAPAAAYGTAHGGLTSDQRDAPGGSAPEPPTAAAAAAAPKQQKRQEKQGEGSGGSGSDGDEQAGPGEEEGAEEEGEGHCSASDRPSSDSEEGGAKEDPDGTGEAARLHRRSATKSEFVANWVRTLTKQGSGGVGPSAAPSRQVSGASAMKAGPRAAATVTGMDLLPVPEMDEEGASGGGEGPARQGSKLAARAQSQRSGALALVGAEAADGGRGSAMAVPKQGESPVGGKGGGGGRKGKGGAGDGAGSDDGEDGQSDKGSGSERGSEAEGSQAASAMSGGWRGQEGTCTLHSVWSCCVPLSSAASVPRKNVWGACTPRGLSGTR